MPKYQASHVRDDEDHECPEVVGSTDLREVFKDKGRICGAFSINGHMFHQFEANSIANLIAQLENAHERTHVEVSIDDGYHLVLEAKSPAPIVIALGPAYQEVAPAGRDPVAQQVVEGLKEEARRHSREEDRREEERNTILDDLGLQATEQDPKQPATAAPGVPQPGLSAEDRKKRREEQGKAPTRPQDGTERQNLPGTNTPMTWEQKEAARIGSQGQTPIPDDGNSSNIGGRDANQERYNPIAGSDQRHPS